MGGPPLFLILFLIPLVLLARLWRSRRARLPPGPFALPLFGNWLQVGNDLNHRFLASLAAKFGPIVHLRLGLRDLVVVSDPKFASEVLHGQGVEFGSRPRSIVFDIFTGNGQDMVFTVYGDHWRKMRRIMTVPFFTNKVVQQYRGMWAEEMDRVVADLRSAPPEGLLVRHRLHLMLYNVMFGMMFDSRFESTDDPLYKEAKFFNSERSRLSQSFEYNCGDFIPFLRPFVNGYLDRCRDLQKRRLEFFDTHFVQRRRRVLAEQEEKERSTGRRKEDKKLSCAMDHIIEAEKAGEITSDNVLYIVENINVAAIETTLWSMEWAVAEMVNHGRVQHKVREEIREVLGDKPLEEEDLARLPYLQAVVKETLRLHPPIPLLVPHMNLEEAELGGYTIPKESKVVINAWWLANNPEWWNRPEEYRPERFMEEETATNAIAAGKVDFRFLPFGVGRRSCPGIILALPLLGMVIGKLVTNFEILPPPGLEKIDMAEKGGQFSLRLAEYPTVVFKPLVKA